MILSNSRIEKNNNIKFYEQDLLIDNHIYSNNIDISIKVDYHQPGLGIALIANESSSLNKDTNMYLYKIGCNDYSLIRKDLDTIDIIDNGSLINVKPFIKDMIFRVKKYNNRLYLYINDEEISNRYMPTDMSNFIIGYYSNAGNIIKSINIASSIPQGWNVNMRNTNGGYINFYKNMFSVSNCTDIAEVEQNNIQLKANTDKDKYYYLKYETDEVNGICDIQAYIFKSSDDRYNVNEKNLLIGNKFKILKDEVLTLRFEGKSGSVKNIQVTTNIDDAYTGTDYDTSDIKGSYIKINTEELTKIEVESCILQVPNKEDIFDTDSEYAIIEDSEKKYTTRDLNISIGAENLYSYTIDLGLEDLLKIENDTMNKTINLKIDKYINLFKNVDARIFKLILYKKDGTITNVIVQDEKKHYVPIMVNSPIIAVSENEEPLNLSSSYRFKHHNNDIEYIFTNIEREVFEPKNRLYLESKVSEKPGSIKIYGILKDSVIEEDCLMAIEKDVNDIHLYSKKYDIYNESNIYSSNKDLGTITITDKDDIYIQNRYQKLVVDYLKRDSYAINYKHENMNIEVDVSSKETVLLKYDIAAKNNIGNNVEYKILDTETKNNSYIVLKGR